MVDRRPRPFAKRRPRDDRGGSAGESSVDTADWLVGLEAGQGVPHPTVALIAAVYVGLRAIRRALARIIGLALS